MAQINEAWRVLSEPGRRAIYDMQSRPSGARPMSGARESSTTAPTAAATATAARPCAHQPPPAPTPARFPWRFMAVIATLGIAFILVNAALTKPSPAEVPDNLIGPGSCVDIAANHDAVEVTCDGFNDGVVDSLIATDAICPQDTESHRDHQGMGQVCVRMAHPSG